jgi:hypothetical protein
VANGKALGFGCAALIGCNVLLACSSSTTGVEHAPGEASGAASMSGAAGASSGSRTPASGFTSGTMSGAGMGASGGSGATMDAGGDGPAASGTTIAAMDSGTGDSGFPPITECMKPSVDRLEVWTSSGPAEGTTIPPTGDLLVKEGNAYVAKVQFLNVEWHVCPVYLGNQFSANANLSASSGFLLTYSSTSDIYVQARPTSHWSGGDQWATLIPSTGGVKKSLFITFEPAKWKSLFGTPTWTLADALKEVLGFVFVGQMPNTITFYGLRFDGYVPPCR